MGDESEDVLELHIHDGVLLKYHSIKKDDLDLLNNLGTLSIVEYKSDLGKCIEWHQCDVSIESDDQEWAIVRDSKYQNGSSNGSTKNSKMPIIQIPVKNLLNFKVSKGYQQITLVESGVSVLTTFYFQNGDARYLVNFLTSVLNCALIKKKDAHLFIVRSQKEVQVLERSFAELDLFSDDNTRTDAVWGFIRKLHDNPYETTMSAFSKVTDALLYRPQQNEMDEVAELFHRSLTSDDLPDSQGRISTEDYELIGKGLPLPPRTLPPRSSPLTEDQWMNYLDEFGKVTDPDMVKERIFHGGISPEGELRTEVWKFLLGYYPWSSTYSEREEIKKQKKEEYFTMKLQWRTMTVTQENNFAAYKERKSLIEKDVFRTDRNMAYFAGDNNPNLEVLQDILMTYVMFNFDLGYVQGMSDLLSPLLVQLNDEVDAFWCFTGFMDKVSTNFELDQAGMKQQLQQLYCLLCCIEPELSSYLELHDSSNMSFCFRWLLILFKREFSYEEIYVLWEALWSQTLCKNFQLLICAAILDTEKETLMSKNYGFTEILKHVNELALKIDLNLILRKAEGIYVQLTTAAKIPSAVREIIGLEPLPELELEINEKKNHENGFSEEPQPNSNAENGGPGQNTPYFSTDSQELGFDNSISLHYL